MLVVVVDTEAEFDWEAARPRRAMGVTSVKCQDSAQRIFERYGVRPTFVLDFPVSSTPEAFEFIRDLHRSGACEIGAHLQPWDNPPLVEQITDENSYPGNLPFELEREKLIQLTRSIQANIGVRPRIYKAGRYGVGRATAAILAELGYEIDVSVVPGTNLTCKFGPDFTHCRASPYWFGKNPELLEIPLSIGYTGLLADTGNLAYTLTMNERLKALHEGALDSGDPLRLLFGFADSAAASIATPAGAFIPIASTKFGAFFTKSTCPSTRSAIPAPTPAARSRALIAEATASSAINPIKPSRKPGRTRPPSPT